MSNQHLDLNQLRARLQDQPRTKAGQLRRAWPDIKDLLAAGHSLKDVCVWLNEMGLQIGYPSLSHYITQLRLRDQATQAPIQDLLRGLSSGPREQARRQPQGGEEETRAAVTSDPLRNVRQQRARKNGFQYNPFPSKGLTE